jgi:hypothetical protein
VCHFIKNKSVHSVGETKFFSPTDTQCSVF